MRLDKALVAAGLAPSRARAAQLISAGVVLAEGKTVTKASTDVEPADLSLKENPIPWVSRGALKLVHALEHWGLSPEGAVAMDLGASTGGFTEVLLKNGAAQVYAVDVGHGQLAPTLRNDPRVTNLEKVNAKDLPETIPPIDWLVCDLSFISLNKALPNAFGKLKPGGACVALIKPQFEVGKAALGKGGVVRDPQLHDSVCTDITAFFTDSGFTVHGLTQSPIQGSDGNIEFLIYATLRDESSQS